VTGCNLGCGFCQNYQISHDGMGRAVGTAEFARIALTLQAEGAENINIVTGSHAVPAIAAGLDAAKTQGLHIPVLWNSSAYESRAALELLRDRVDVYLPDLKTLDPQVGQLFFRAPDYPEHAAAAILRMISYRGELQWKEPAAPGIRSTSAAHSNSVLARGTIIRHLIIPGYLESTREVIKWFRRHAQGKALLSLMTQYVPLGRAGDEKVIPAAHAAPQYTPSGAGQGAGKADIPQRYLIREEYDQVMDWLTEYEIEDGFYQEPVTGREWLPDFTRPNPFSSRLSRPVWHWRA
jgi:putative pyruvate formate lyase activating enzyme